MTHCATDNLYLTEVSPKDKPWDRHKRNAVAVAELYGQGGLHRESARVGGCANRLEMTAIANNEGDMNLKLRHAEFCRVRHCPICQWRKTMKWSSRLRQGLPKLLADHPKHRWIFVTLTVPNCDLTDLKTTLQAMQRGFVRLTQLKDFPGVGWVKAVEITRNPDTDQAHPHIHALVMVASSYFGGYYLKQSDWSEMWAKSMRFSFTPIVDIRVIKERKRMEENGRDNITLSERMEENGTNENRMEDNGREWNGREAKRMEQKRKSKMEENGISLGLSDAICETVKYSIKESDLKYSAQWLCELSKQVRLSRSITLGGVFRDYFRDEQDGDDLVFINDETRISRDDFDDLPSFDFGFNERKLRYIH